MPELKSCDRTMTNELVDEGEILFRQIHPEFMDNGEPTSQGFGPTAKDEGKLSVDRSAITDPKSSYELYIKSGLRSAGVYGITVGECRAESLTCHPEPAEKIDQRPENPAHSFVDFRRFSVSQQKNKAKRLKRAAIARGKLHPPLAT
jgi:hypothetical protein